MKDEYTKALAKILVYEGGKVDDPRDPGGRTNQGVTQRVFNAYLISVKKKPRDVYTMTDAERNAIYRKRYWDEIYGDDLPPGIGFVVFDGAVNSGCSQSVKWVQRALGAAYTGKVDGQLGMFTIQAIKKHPDHDKLIAAILDRRMAFLTALKHWKTYKNGWTDRVNHTRQVGQAWAMGSVGPEISYTPGMEAKANVEDAKPIPIKAVADVVTGAGATTATGAQGITQALDSTKEQLAQFSGVSFVEKFLLALTVAGIVLAAGGFAYRFIMARQERARADVLDLDPQIDRG